MHQFNELRIGDKLKLSTWRKHYPIESEHGAPGARVLVVRHDDGEALHINCATYESLARKKGWDVKRGGLGALMDMLRPAGVDMDRVQAGAAPSGVADDGTTAHRVWCATHGNVHLTDDEYTRQMLLPNARWACPRCGREAQYDDAHREKFEAASTTAHDVRVCFEHVTGRALPDDVGPIEDPYRPGVWLCRNAFPGDDEPDAIVYCAGPHAPDVEQGVVS